MRVFVIGIAGGVGHRVATQLLSRGSDVAGLVRHGAPDGGAQQHGVQFVVGDLVTIPDDELAAALRGSDVVLFAAGAGGEGDPEATTRVDGEGPIKVARAAEAVGVGRFILVSVFPEAWRERHMNDGFEHYMAEKKKAETHIVRTDLDWVILRPAALSDEPGLGRIDLGLAKIHTGITRDDVASTLVELINRPRVRRVILEVTAGEEEIRDAVDAFENRLAT